MKKHHKLKKKPKSFLLKSCTENFKKIYSEYLDSLHAKTFEINLMTALEDYRRERLNMLPDKDVIKEECGEAFRKMGKSVNVSRRYSIKTISTGQYEKPKDGKLGVVTLFKKFNKEGKFDPPGYKAKPFLKCPLSKKMVINHKLYNDISSRNLTTENTCLTLPSITENSSITYKTSPKKFRKTSQQQIEKIADSIAANSGYITKDLGNSMSHFNAKYNKWKSVKTYLLPEIIKVGEDMKNI